MGRKVSQKRTAIFSQFFSTIVLFLTVFASATGVASAQQSAESFEASPVTDYQGVRRGKVYHATRTTERIVIDGNIDDEAWSKAEVGGSFYQTEPKTGYPATEATEFRLMYDDKNIYVGVICHQDGPTIISELRRDFAPVDGDQLIVLFDTFDDDRNGFAFHTNPGSAMRDAQVTGGVRDENWDGIFEVASRIQSPGWTAEFAIPFKTLRFDSKKANQRWGFNIERIIRYKFEIAQWAPAERPFKVYDIFTAGALEGIEGLRQGRNLYVKPFVVGDYKPDAKGGVFKKKDADAGLDIKYGVTSGLTLDATLNTDFSQVEADEQQVNLTRFSLFFPEKREFFLENSGLFDVGGSSGQAGGGGGGGGGRGGGGGGGGRYGGGRDVIPFFSRRIGLSADGTELPIRAGARLTGKFQGLDVGLMNIQVGAQQTTPSDNWTVIRLKRDVLANSDFGAFLFNRDSSVAGNWNRAGGLDGNFRFLRRRLIFSGFAMRSQTPGPDERNLAANVESSYQDNFYNFSAAYATIEENFRNDLGFIPRSNIRKATTSVGFRPRPRSGIIRELYPRLNSRYTMDQSNRVLTRFHALGNQISFRDGASFMFYRNMTFERLQQPFLLRGKVTVNPGDYAFDDWNFNFNTSRARRIYGGGGYNAGDFWTGTIREIRASAGYRANAHAQVNLNWTGTTVKLPEAKLRSDLVGMRLDLAFSPKMFLENFIQYNTDAKTVSSNIRYRFIHHPLSDFFVVYNEVRGISGNKDLNRALSLKMTHVLNF